MGESRAGAPAANSGVVLTGTAITTPSTFRGNPPQSGRPALDGGAVVPAEKAFRLSVAILEDNIGPDPLHGIFL